MQFMKRLALLSHLPRLLSSLSVRTRIVVLALIPVAGSLANGITYLSGEEAVGSAFATVQQSNALADASRDFKSAVNTMRIVVKDFTAKPSDTLVIEFEAAEGQAMHSLDVVGSALDKRHSAGLGDLRGTLEGLQTNFNTLVQEQRELGFDKNSGLNGKLNSTGNAVERIINENVNWLTEFDAQRLMLSLLTMRHEEAQYRLNQAELSRQLFFASKDQFTALFDNIDGKADRKALIAKQVDDYSNVFSDWVASFNHIDPLRKMIDLDTQDMLPRTDQIIAHARTTMQKAAEQLAAEEALAHLGG